MERVKSKSIRIIFAGATLLGITGCSFLEQPSNTPTPVTRSADTSPTPTLIPWEPADKFRCLVTSEKKPIEFACLPPFNENRVRQYIRKIVAKCGGLVERTGYRRSRIVSTLASDNNPDLLVKCLNASK